VAPKFGTLNKLFQHPEQMPMEIPREGREDQVRMPSGKLLQQGYELGVNRDFPLFPALGNESILRLCPYHQETLHEIEISPMWVGKFLFSYPCVVEGLEDSLLLF